ncbi:MAG TPA: tRNA (adenosine(37)-N6)-threonylcarbamoyltransferase complex ATPase subunit type 1 TsaE [Acidimicrobiales bacterium]|nr:tRNA (adenosine(37)-N6)-threonylcarbamoyltransferase complex ATPase subunit type 1 TsaE [Acidimicrobiales bacterium]
MLKALTKSAEDTRELAAAIAVMARAQDVVLLSGDLGAGKTTFAQGFGRGLGVTEPIVSPTFTLVRTYKGRLPLVHCDVYRLDRLEEVADLDLPELLDDGGVALVEWGDAIAPALVADFLEVRMELDEADDARRLDLRVVGPSWTARLRALSTAIGRWAT